jgi:pantetheine-phosphate adenylyltransferase
MNPERTAIYPGSFDPITYGHIDIIKRAVTLFDQVIIAVARNIAKSPLFSEQERVHMIEASLQDVPRVKVDSFSGLLVDYARTVNAHAVIRGLRAVSDFEFELQMALVNRKLDEQLVTVFLMPHENYTYLNSSIVKELARFGGDVTPFVPPLVHNQLIAKLRNV